MSNEISIVLPNGNTLVAREFVDIDYPGIQLYLQHGEDEDTLCFVEYNCERAKGKELCIGAYTVDNDDTIYYESYHRGAD